MADHAINESCRKDRDEMKDILKRLQYIILGNGVKEESILFRLQKMEEEKTVSHEMLDEYVTKDELTISHLNMIKTLATKEDIEKLSEAIEKKFVRKSDSKRGFFMLAKVFGAAVLTAGGSIIVALIMKGV